MRSVTTSSSRDLCMTRRLIAMILACAASLDAQAPLTSRDSAQLADLATASIRAYPALAAATFAWDPGRAPPGPFARRLVTALRAGTTSTQQPGRSTPRAWIGEPTLVGDTVSVMVLITTCRDDAEDRFSGQNSVHRFMRVGNGWKSAPAELSERGSGRGCRW